MKSFKYAEIWLFGLVILCFILAAGCGGGVQRGLIKSYEIQYPGCTTTPLLASTHDEFCKTLSDNNKFINPTTKMVCAEEQRERDFAANCPGYTWPN